MIRETESSEPGVSESCATYEMLLDQLAEVLREADAAGLEAFLGSHPQEEQQLRQMVPTLRAMAEMVEPDNSLEAGRALDAGERYPAATRRSAIFASSANWVAAAWASSTSPNNSRSIGRWHSRSCRWPP